MRPAVHRHANASIRSSTAQPGGLCVRNGSIGSPTVPRSRMRAVRPASDFFEATTGRCPFMIEKTTSGWDSRISSWRPFEMAVSISRTFGKIAQDCREMPLRSGRSLCTIRPASSQLLAYTACLEGVEKTELALRGPSNCRQARSQLLPPGCVCSASPIGMSIAIVLLLGILCAHGRNASNPAMLSLPVELSRSAATHPFLVPSMPARITTTSPVAP